MSSMIDFCKETEAEAAERAERSAYPYKLSRLERHAAFAGLLEQSRRDGIAEITRNLRRVRLRETRELLRELEAADRGGASEAGKI